VRQTAHHDDQVAIKGTRWRLLYRRDTLPRGKVRQLPAALKANQPLATASIRKEELAWAGAQESWKKMADFCCAWGLKAIAGNIHQWVAMAQTLTGHAEGILA
jgi:hypothetical protein